MKYLVQTQSPAKSSGIKLPEVHGISKGIDPNVQPEKQVIKPIAITKMKEVSQVKPMLGQGRAGLRCKIKTPIPKPIAQVTEKPIQQPTVMMPETSKYGIEWYQYQIMQFLIQNPKMIDVLEWLKENMQDINREIPIHPDPVICPLPKPVKKPIPNIPGSLLDTDQ